MGSKKTIQSASVKKPSSSRFEKGMHKFNREHEQGLRRDLSMLACIQFNTDLLKGGFSSTRDAGI